MSLTACKAGCGSLTAKLYCEACRVPKAEGAEGWRDSPPQDRTGGRTGALKAGEYRPAARSSRTTKPQPKPRTEGLGSLTLTLYGAPRTKKTHNRIVVHEGRHKVLPSEQWTAWRDKVLASKDIAPWMRLRDQPYNCAALFYRDADRGDMVGYMQGLADVLEGAGVVSNDKFIVAWDGSRMLVDKQSPRVEITLTRV